MLQSVSTTKAILPTQPVVLFDGICNLCHHTVQFIVLRDKKGVFRFASLQSTIGKQLIDQHQLSVDYLNTLVVIEGKRAYLRSDAVLKIAQRLGGWWSLAMIFWIVPRFIRDAVYNWVSRNRYRWWGKKEQCLLMTPDLRERFLEKNSPAAV